VSEETGEWQALAPWHTLVFDDSPYKKLQSLCGELTDAISRYTYAVADLETLHRKIIEAEKLLDDKCSTAEPLVNELEAAKAVHETAAGTLAELCDEGGLQSRAGTERCHSDPRTRSRR